MKIVAKYLYKNKEIEEVVCENVTRGELIVQILNEYYQTAGYYNTRYVLVEDNYITKTVVNSLGIKE